MATLREELTAIMEAARAAERDPGLVARRIWDTIEPKMRQHALMRGYRYQYEEEISLLPTYQEMNQLEINLRELCRQAGFTEAESFAAARQGQYFLARPQLNLTSYRLHLSLVW